MANSVLSDDRFHSEEAAFEYVETAITNSRKTKRGPGRKRPHTVVLSLVERGGDVRSFVLDHRMVGPMIRRHVHEDSRLVTDKAQHYKHPAVARHESVDHSK